MTKIVGIVALLLALSVPLTEAALSLKKPNCVIAVNGDICEITISQVPIGTVVVTGAGTGTLQFEGTLDRATYFSVPASPIISGAVVTSTTAIGQWGITFVGESFRVRASSAITGTYVVNQIFTDARLPGTFVGQLPPGTASSGCLGWSGRSQICSSADSLVNVTPNNAGSQLSRFTFGPESAASSTISPVSSGTQAWGIIIQRGDGAPQVFANLGAATNGAMVYCSDCTKATPCAGAGTGAIAKRYNGTWDCN